MLTVDSILMNRGQSGQPDFESSDLFCCATFNFINGSFRSNLATMRSRFCYSPDDKVVVVYAPTKNEKGTSRFDQFVKSRIVQSIIQNDQRRFDQIMDKESFDPNDTKGTPRWTPLMLAIQGNRLKMIQKLLDVGSNPNILDAGYISFFVFNCHPLH